MKKWIFLVFAALSLGVQASDKHNAALYFNQGLEYRQAGDLGRAILFYRKALLLNPRYQPALKNLAQCRAEVEEAPFRMAPFFLADWWARLRGLMPVNAWGVIALVWIWAAAFVWWRSRRLWRSAGLVALSVLCLLSGVSRMLGIRANQEAVVVASKADMREAGDSDSKFLRTLYPGTEMWVRDSIGKWKEVALPNGEWGWVESDSLEMIAIQ